MMDTRRLHFWARGFTRGFVPVLLAAMLILSAGSCSWFGFGDDEAADEEEAEDIFAAGMLKAIAGTAPKGSNSQYLAGIADQFGWEKSLARNKLLRMAVEEEEFNSRVEPYLISLFYRNGFSVLPRLGEGHQIARDTLVRGAVGTSRYLVMTREQVRIIFLGPVQGVQLIYPRDGTEPQIFSRDENGTIAVRASLVRDQLR
jgi:hypothetical protein